MTISKKIKVVLISLLWRLKSLFLGKRASILFLQMMSIDTRISLHDDGIIEIGEMCQTRSSVDFSAFGKGKISIADGCFFNRNCSITSFESISIGRDSSFGNNVVIVDHDHNFRDKDGTNAYVSTPISIGSNVWVGANSVILRGCSIGDGAVIAAGSVVSSSIPPNMVFLQKKDYILKDNIISR